MAMLNNQRVYIYISVGTTSMSKETFHFLPVFFSTVHRDCTPESLPLEGTRRESKKLYGFAWWSLQNMVFPICSPCFMSFAGKIAAGNVQLASRWSSPCWKEQRSLRAMSGSLGVGKLEPHPMVGSRKQHENMSCILGIRDIVEIWWICWHIEMMLLYVVVFLHFAVYMLELVTYFQVCSILLLTKWLRRIFLLKSKGIDFACISTTWTMNTERLQVFQQMLQKQVLSSRFCRVASTRFKLYTPVFPSISSTGWWFGTFFIFPFSWECHHPNWL